MGSARFQHSRIPETVSRNQFTQNLQCNVFGKVVEWDELVCRQKEGLMIGSRSTATTEDERARRVAEAAHSVEMEGLQVDPDTMHDAGEYIAGRIDSSEVIARARARYGLA